MKRFSLAFASALLVHVVCAKRILMPSTKSWPSTNPNFGNITVPNVHHAFPDFSSWYEAHKVGRGIWKWKHALAIYQYHLQGLYGQDVALMEIGVRSGGQINMWMDNLGAKLKYYGWDTDTRCLKFQYKDPRTTIFLANPEFAINWEHFFGNVVPTHEINVGVDDGGHTAPKRFIALKSNWPHIATGGVFMVENIHVPGSQTYHEQFFTPTAQFLGAQAETVASVHIYPFTLVVRKVGRAMPQIQENSALFTTMGELIDALPKYRGQAIGLQNPRWGSFHTVDNLAWAFLNFYELHGAYQKDVPAGCYMKCMDTPADKALSPCQINIPNNRMQNLIGAVHVYPTWLQIQVLAEPPAYFAERKGTWWLRKDCSRDASSPIHKQERGDYGEYEPFAGGWTMYGG